MKRFPQPIVRLTLVLSFIFLMGTVLCGIPPNTAARAAVPGSSLFQKLPDSTPGNFTVTWYSAKKYIAHPGESYYAAHIGINNSAQVDKDASDAALKNWDTSVVLKQEVMSDLTFDMSMWQPDSEYNSVYNWTWCEINGFVKVDSNNVGKNILLDPNRQGRDDVTYDLEVPDRGHIIRMNTPKFVPFRLRIKCCQPAQSKLNDTFSPYLSYGYYFDGEPEAWDGILSQDLYGTLALKDMQSFFQLDAPNYTLTLDPQYKNFPVEDYEYGFAGETDFKPLALGPNYLGPGKGDVIIRYKSWPSAYITIGTITPPAQGRLTITGRTPGTASLAWSAPTGGAAPTGYDIYRQKVDWMSGLSPYIHYFDNTFNTAQKVGSTSGLTYTDQGLNYELVYAYYVVANYAAGNITESNTVRTDAVTMQGLPSTPLHLRVDLKTQNKVALTWSRQGAQINEYIIYRKVTALAPTTYPRTSTGAIILVGGLSDETEREIGRSSGNSFDDSGVAYGDQCEYSVQAVDDTGIPSLLSATVTITIPDLTPPTAPGNLQVGDVMRQGDNVQYAFPESTGIRNVVLGPKREIVLRWDPSTIDAKIAPYNVGVAAYNIYRSVVGYNSADNAFRGEQNKLVGSTKDTSFIDSGLEFGATYTYYVKALDSQGNTSTSNPAYIGTEKSTLAGLAISNGSQTLTPDPAFAYYQTEYTLNVDNSVKCIELKTTKTDPEAKITVNGTLVGSDDSSGPLTLDAGKNVLTIEVAPRRGAQWFIEPETMRYTLTVNRANLDNLPELTLPEDGIILNEGDTYKEAGRLDIPEDLAWTGTADYGDGSGEKPVQLNKDGSFILEHQYLDNGRYTINVKFRYKDLGLVKGTLEATVQNVAPTLTGVKDEYTAGECSPLTIEGSIADPGQDSWTVSGDYGSEWGPTRGTVNQRDQTFTLQDYFNDQKPEYDMVLKVKDDDGGESSRNVKIRVENVPPAVQASGPALVQAGVAFTGTGSFTDPGLDTWQATVDYGDGSGEQPLSLRNDKTFDLNHTYLKTGKFTVNVRVEDQDGGAGSASFQVKVKDYIFRLEAGEDASLNEGDQLVRDIPVQGRPDKVKSITADYGDGSGEQSIAWSQDNDAKRKDQSVAAGWLPLQHTYTDNGSYPVKIKLTDVDGDSYEDGFIVNAANVEPTVQLDSINNMYPGNTFTGHGSINDPGADTWTVTIDYKDGSTPDRIDINPDKTFSFSHTYKYSGNYNIEAVVSDDDGGIGRGNTPATVLSPSSGGGSSSDDAALHSFDGIPDLKQNDGVHAGDGFIPDCLEYKSTAGFVHTQITVAAAPGAALTYTIDGGPAQVLAQNQPTGIDLDAGHTLKIQITARDGVTTREYTFAHL